VIPEAASPAAHVTSSAPGITDWLTGIGTVSLAVVTVVTLGITIWITTTDRRGAEEARHRERQQDSAGRLLVRIAALIPHCDLVPGVYKGISTLPGQPGHNWRRMQCYEAMRALEFGAHAETSGLGDPRGAGQYRELVHLVITAAQGVPRELHKRAGVDLRRYAIFVRVSLEHLIEAGQSLDPGQPAVPLLLRNPPEDSPWQPDNVPMPWRDALGREPGDPLFRPAP